MRRDLTLPPFLMIVRIGMRVCWSCAAKSAACAAIITSL